MNPMSNSGDHGSPRTLRALSLGAGVQSSTLALLAEEGALTGLDVAVFGDTGWEPKAVYETVDALELTLAAVGIPLHRVSRGKSIREDVLDRHVFATLPAYIVEEVEVREPLTWHVCSCQLGDLLRAGATPDSLRESEHIEDECCDWGRVVTEWHTYTVEKRGTIKRQCTGKYKIEPVEKKIRELLGATVWTVECRYCQGTGKRLAPWDIDAGEGECSVCRGTGERRRVGSVPDGATVEQWIGFSTDEVERVTTAGFPAYATPRFPLIELGMSRTDCINYLRERGWTKVAKSACIGCPFHRNDFWRDMRDNRPDEWADACDFDDAFRYAPGLNGRRYLHESCVPLRIAPIERFTRLEKSTAQGSLLDLIVVGQDEPRGCNPYGCRAEEDAA